MVVCEYLDQQGVPGAGFPTMGRLRHHGDRHTHMRSLWGARSAAGRTHSACEQASDDCAGTAARNQHGRTADSTEAESGRAPVLADKAEARNTATFPE